MEEEKTMTHKQFFWVNWVVCLLQHKNEAMKFNVPGEDIQPSTARSLYNARL